MVALLLLGITLINPARTSHSNALTIQNEWVVVDNIEEEQLNNLLNESGNTETSTSSVNPTDTSTSSIVPLAATPPTPTVSIDISGAGANDEVDVVLGETNYREHKINISVSDVISYVVMISGDSVLTPPTEGQTFTSANGATGNTMADYTWGYGWADMTIAKEDMAYKAPTSTVEALAAPNLSSGTVNFSKKLVFAAKFPTSALAGEYRTTNGITLSVIANAKSNTRVWLKPDGTESDVVLADSITDMHTISPGFCRENNDVKPGYSIQMQDYRDKNIYTIKKLSDGNCWMIENLRLPSGIELSPTTSDITNIWTLPNNMTDKLSNWSKSATAQQMAEGNVNMTVYNTGGKWQPEYGNYYSWCTATAGTCTNDGNAPSSICPKNWHLPPNSDNPANNVYGSFVALNNTGTGTWQSTPIIINGLSYNGAIIGNGDSSAFFPAAGYVYSTGLSYASSYGYYWSSSAINSNEAYRLIFNENSISPQNNDARYYGFSVRCVATY